MVTIRQSTIFFFFFGIPEVAPYKIREINSPSFGYTEIVASLL